MKKLMLLTAMILAISPITYAAPKKGKAKAKDCSFAIYKTYLPSDGSRVCDKSGFPAEFAGGYLMLGLFLKKLGYDPVQYDQCKNGNENQHAYTLFSQMGCDWSGRCGLGIGVSTADSRIVYENKVYVSSGNISLVDALKDLPSCNELPE